MASFNPAPMIGAILNPVAQLALVPVTDHIRYLVSCRKHRRELEKKFKELNAAKSDAEENMDWFKRKRFEIPSHVGDWLKDVENITLKEKNIPSDVGCCFNIKRRHKVGRKASKLIEEIDHVLKRYSSINWPEHRIVPARPGPINPSTPSSNHHNEFPSREHIFKEALEALQPDQHKTHMVALCGMGGVGKTEMVKRLKKFVQEKKLFHFVIDVSVGKKTDIDVQKDVAHHFDEELKDAGKPARIVTLRNIFEANSDGGEKKFLIILDDLWEPFDMYDIGLSHLPNQGVDFKVLLASRDIDVCNEMGVEANSVLNVEVLTEVEAQSLFRQVVKISDDVDRELNKIGEDIVRKCDGLPSAINKLAIHLRNKCKDTWEDTLSSLKHRDIGRIAPTGFEMSYDSLQDETQSIFSLCGLFPKAIPTEDLVRYGWGLKLFKNVFTMRDGRIRLNTHIEELKHKNLLKESEDVRCVRMHDLMLSFILNMLSKGKDASFVKYGTMQGVDDMSISYERISSTWKGITDFPKDLTNLSILKLMQGDESLNFPEDFYSVMKKLKVIAFDNVKRCLPINGCSTTLRVLHLHRCPLLKDCSSIANLYNLEVLSFAKSENFLLPSKIGKLKNLRLLDLTDCSGTIDIEKGVFTNLDRLEELYAIADRNAIRFTDDNYDEIAERSKDLFALELDLSRNNAQPKNMSFEKLKRFKIYVGRFLDGDFSKSRHSYENTLQLVTNIYKLHKFKMNELFEETEVLCLSVGDMNDLEDVEVKSSYTPRSSSFSNVRVLVVSRCEEMKYLFNLGVAKALSKLEHLQVDECNKMEELIHTDSSKKKVTFLKLKFLYLCGLRKLSGLCNNVNMLELPQLVELKLIAIPNIKSIYPTINTATSCLLKKKIEIPKLEILQIGHMENLKEIWPGEWNTIDKFMLRVIHVGNCSNLVNLFPCNPMLFLHHLEEIQVTSCHSIEVLFPNSVGEIREESNNISLKRIQVRHCDNIVQLFPCNPMPLLDQLEELQVQNCGSIEVLFNIDVHGSSGEGCNSSSLRRIQVRELEKLREVWRINGADNSGLPIRGFQAVESISIEGCKRFSNIFTPITANLELVGLTSMNINHREIGRCNDHLAESDQKKECQYYRETEILDCEACVIPSNAVAQIQNLQVLKIEYCDSIKEVFETRRINNNVNMLPILNLKILEIVDCGRLEYILTFSALDSLKQLEDLTIMKCKTMKVIVKEEEGDQVEAVVFRRLKSIALVNLPNLEGFFFGKNDFRWPMLDDVTIKQCPKLTKFTHGRSTAPELMYIDTCSGKRSPGECGIEFHANTAEHHQGIDCIRESQTQAHSFGSYFPNDETKENKEDVVDTADTTSKLLQTKVNGESKGVNNEVPFVDNTHDFGTEFKTQGPIIRSRLKGNIHPSIYLQSPYRQVKTITQLSRSGTSVAPMTLYDLDIFLDDRIFELYRSSNRSILEFSHHLWDTERVDMQFWNELFGNAGNGYLTQRHVMIWIRTILSIRPMDSRWSIMPCGFEDLRNKSWVDSGNGIIGAAWWTIDRVYVPLNVPDVHWFLGELDLVSWKLTLYDSCGQLGYTRKKTDLTTFILKYIPEYLDQIKYWDEKGIIPYAPKITIHHANSVPQQKSEINLGDCGVFMCMFIEQLTKSQHLEVYTSGSDYGIWGRCRLAQILLGSHYKRNA